jgi:MSHA biogenesis protein MshQ
MNTAGTITSNYAGAFARETTLTDANAASNNSDTLGAFANAVIPLTQFINGVATLDTTVYKLSYTFTDKETAPLEVRIGSAPLKMRAIETADPTITSIGYAEGLTPILSGRVRMANAYGTERLALSVVAQTEYYNGSAWVLNTGDNSPVLTAAPGLAQYFSTVSISSSATCNGSACTTISPLTAGSLGLVMAAPNAPGYVDVTLDVPVWLQYPWHSATATNPTARVTFGIYGGNNRVIYRRESY